MGVCVCVHSHYLCNACDIYWNLHHIYCCCCCSVSNISANLLSCCQYQGTESEITSHQNDDHWHHFQLLASCVNQLPRETVDSSTPSAASNFEVIDLFVYCWILVLSLKREREREKFIYHVRTQQIHIQVRQW